MAGAEFCLDHAVFTYVISKALLPAFEQHVPVFSGELTLNHTSATEVRIARGEADLTEIAVIGLCVDAHGEFSRDEVPGRLLEEAGKGIGAVYDWAGRLAGRYVICCRTQEGSYIFGDATASMQINYCFKDGGFCAASTDCLAAEALGCPVSEYSVKIRNGSGYLQGMPGDLTMYDSVYALLPDHYLDIGGQRSVRVPWDVRPARTGAEIDEVIERSAFLIRNTVSEYRKHYELVCPLTSGYDSRLAFSFLKEQIDGLDCYTFMHQGFTEDTDDIKVPGMICGKYGLRHMVIRDLPAPDEFTAAIKRAAGTYHADSTIALACTYLSRFSGKALIDGDIIDQVGKSLLGNALPNRFATPAFFQCKLHNIESAARRELKKSLDEIRSQKQEKYIYDLFAVENRCGRWAAQGGTLYALASITTLNIFNCRELILLWVAVDRKLRTNKLIHVELFKKTDPDLLKYPFNPSSKLSVLSSNPYTFLLATYAKFFLQRLRGKR